MTHVPPQFRKPQVLVDEWRRRANAFRMSDPAVAEAFAQCADELSELDVHTESATDGTPLDGDWTLRMGAVAPWLAASALGVGVIGLVWETARRRHVSDRWRGRLVADRHDATPPHGDKLLRPTHARM